MTVYMVFWDMDFSRIGFESIHKTREGAEKAIANLLAVRKLDCYDNYVIDEEELLED